MADNRETIEMLKMLKGQALKSHNDTAVLEVKIDSFNFVLDEAIKALEQQLCEEKGMTALEKWKNDFKGFISELSMPEDDYKGIMEYIDEVPNEALEQQPCEDWHGVPSDEMTLEQARQAVKDLRKMLPEYLEQNPNEDCISREEALMALTGDITDCTIEEFIARLRDKLSKLPSINVTTNEDCISREDLLKAFKDECRGECDNCPHFRKDDGEYKCRLIADFPSVTPKEKTGHWIRWYETIEQEHCTIHDPHCKCSECNQEYDPYIASLFNYCPNCGAKMIEPTGKRGRQWL